MDSPDRQKIIIDTDCGIDDAIALLLALSSKDVADVIAITCCFGNTSLDNVCSNVMRVLTVCEERDIPIHRGCNGPLIKHELNPGLVHGSDGLGNCAHEFSTGDLKESDIPAPVALVNLAKKYPKQITLVAIGPLTNLAVAHRIDPEFTKNLKSISIMGGNYKGIGNTTEVAEFNFFCDPESANMVVTEALCPIVLVPWETTMEFGIPWVAISPRFHVAISPEIGGLMVAQFKASVAIDFYYELVKIDSPKGYFFKRTTANFKRKRDTHPDCDFLAVIAVLYPHAIKATLKSHIEVECKRGLTKGLTVLLRDSARTENRSKIDIITCYDKEVLNSVRWKMLSQRQILNR